MKKILIRFFIVFFICNSVLLKAQTPSYLQKQNYEWAFGGSGFDFTNDTLQQLHTTFTGYSWTMGGEASVCDTNGKLLFYTDGYGIYEGNPAPGNNNYYMAGAYPIIDYTFNCSPVGNNSVGTMGTVYYYPADDGGVIVPMIDSPGKYYVFTNECFMDIYCKGDAILFYSVVDMSLNGGYGGVEPGREAIPVDSNLVGGIETIVGDNCDIWLLVHDSYNTYKAYDITDSGVNPVPVTSLGNNAPGYEAWRFYSQVTCSPNRRKLATLGQDAMEISDFDPATGKVSNTVFQQTSYYNPFTDSSSDATMIAFSPDNTKLYSTGGGNNNCGNCGPPMLLQYDISTGSGPWSPVIANIGYSGPQPYCARIGPDNKIYLDNGSVIDYPNMAGSACNNHFLSANLNGGVFYGIFSGPPPPYNAVPVLSNHDTVTNTQKLNSCFADSAVVMTASDTNGWNYVWSDYSEYRLHTNHRTIDTPGVFVLTYNTPGCQYHVDSFIVGHISYTVNLGADTTFCNGSASSYVLQPHDSTTGSSYQWQDGSSDNADTATTTGTYWVTVNDQGCVASDTVQVRFINIRQSLGNDTTFCAEHPILMILHADTVSGAALLWSNGSTGPILQVQDTGIYWITATDPPCMASDTIQIHAAYCDCAFGMPNAFTPNGDGKNDVFRPVLPANCRVQGYLLTIYNRWGQEVFNSSAESAGWDGTFNGVPADVGTYRYVVQLEAGTENQKKYQKGDVTLIR